jgi:hypothetical protein
MNDIYWHDKRSMPSKQLPSPPPTQPRRSYENALRTKQYQQTDVRLNSHTRTNRNITSPYIQQPTASNRSRNLNGNFPYTSSLYGVYHQSPPPIMTTPSSLHPNQNRHIDIRSQSHHPQQRQLSHSVSEDYYTTKFQEINSYNDEMFDDDENFEENDENSSEIFNYIFDDTGVSLRKKKD